jgi:hypothetical protein
VAAALAAAGCGNSGGGEKPVKPETVQDVVTLGLLRAAKAQGGGLNQLASEFCDLNGVTAAEVRKRVAGEPPLKFECTLSFRPVNDPTTTYSVDYRTRLDGKGCFQAIAIPGSKQVQGTNTFDAIGEPTLLTGCVKLPAD